MSAKRPTTSPDLPPAYPKLSTTSDMPDAATTSEPSEQPTLGAETPPSDTPAVPQASPPPELPAVSPRRGRPSRADQQIAAMQAQIAQLTDLVGKIAQPQAAAPPPPAEPKPPAKPKRADYDDPDAYDDALIEWAAETASARASAKADADRAARQKADKAKTAEEEQAAQAREWAAKWDAARERYGEDFDAIAANDQEPLSPAMFTAITNSDIGPDIAWYLGNNPEDKARIFAIANPVKQALEIGKIEAKITAGLAAAPKPAPEPQPASPPSMTALRPAAPSPRPIRPVRPQSEPVPDEQPTEATSESRIGRRLAELRKENTVLGWGPPQGRA